MKKRTPAQNPNETRIWNIIEIVTQQRDKKILLILFYYKKQETCFFDAPTDRWADICFSKQNNKRKRVNINNEPIEDMNCGKKCQPTLENESTFVV